MAKKEGVLFAEDFWSDIFSKHVAHVVSEYCGCDDDDPQKHNMEMPLRRKEPDGKEERVSREECAEKESRLRKDSDADTYITKSYNNVLNMFHVYLSVGDFICAVKSKTSI